MKGRRFPLLMLAVFITLLGVAASMTASSSQTDQAVEAITSGNLPPGYRDWALISVARIGGKVNDLRAKLGNDVAMTAYRQGTTPFPDGTIIARIAWHAVTSEQNNAALRPLIEQRLSKEETDRLLADSFVAGPVINVQFMVKDSKKWASTGGWKFIEFDNGKPAPQAEGGEKTCYACHTPAADTDFVFTRYVP